MFWNKYIFPLRKSCIYTYTCTSVAVILTVTFSGKIKDMTSFIKGRLKYVELFQRVKQNKTKDSEFHFKMWAIVFVVKGCSGRLSGPARTEYIWEISGEDSSSRDFPFAFHFKAVRLSILIISQCEHPNICSFSLHTLGPFVGMSEYGNVNHKEHVALLLRFSLKPSSHWVR